MNKKGLLAMALVSAMALPVVTACGGGQTNVPETPGVQLDESIYGKAMNDTFFNTIRIDAMLGDPFMMEHDGYYYFTASEGTEITITKSKSMTQMTEGAKNAKTIMRQGELAVQQVWGPELFFFDGHFYCYFTATYGSGYDLDLNRRIYVSRSVTDDALGEWEHLGKMDLPCDYWAIDATYFAWEGHHYISWSGWPYAENNYWEQRIYITELQPDDPSKVISTDPSARIQISCPIYTEWESKGSWMNEGPAFIVSPNGRPYCFYSTNGSQGNWYCMAYCELQGNTKQEMLANLLNPEVDMYGNSVGWVKANRPFMEADIYDKEVIAPGHNSFVKSPDGKEDWIVYHATKEYHDTISTAGWDRLARLQKLSWKDDKPYLEYYPYFSEEIPLPSGEKVNRRVFEAENAELSEGCVVIQATDEVQGEQYIFASNSKSVCLTQETDVLKFNVNVTANGPYVLQVRYSSTSDSQQIKVKINGKEYGLYAPRGNSATAYITTGLFTDLYVKDKPNTVEITCDSDVNIDCIVIDYLER